MSNYLKAVQEELKDWKKALIVVIFTVARLIYGWAWIQSGFEKATTWFSDGKLDSYGLIAKMVSNVQHSHGSDPLHINSVLVWTAQHFFMAWAPVTDVIVVVFEISVGLLVFVGFRVFWAALIGTFMNTQFITSGSANNFGYIWTNLALMKWAKYFELIGIDGYLRAKKGKGLLQVSSNKTSAV